MTTTPEERAEGICALLARGEAAFDKRGWVEMPKADRERYVERALIVAPIIAQAIREAEDAAVKRYIAQAEKPRFPPLSEARALFRYEPENGEISYNYAWGGRPSGTLATVGRKDGYLDVHVRKAPFKRTIKAHRLAWYLHYGEDPSDYEIDHVNGDKSDNRIANLRLATRGQNQVNWTRRRRNNLPPGVKLKNPRSERPYSAQIKRNGVERYLGRFATAEEARAAFLAASEAIDPGFIPNKD